MTEEEFSQALVNFCGLVRNEGLTDTKQAIALLITALALADRGMPGGCSREEFLSMAGHMHDKVRGAITDGVVN